MPIKFCSTPFSEKLYLTRETFAWPVSTDTAKTLKDTDNKNNSLLNIGDIYD